MLLYWLLFSIPAVVALFFPRMPVGFAWSGFVIWLVLIIGFRFEVGGDWFNYLYHLDMAKGSVLKDELEGGYEYLYVLINWFAANVFGGIYLVNLVCGIFFSWGLSRFCQAQPRPWLALVVAVPYLITVVAMGYSRQGVAIGFAMLALVSLMRERLLPFFIFITLGAMFHKSAVILVPLAVFYRRGSILLVGLVSAMMFVVLLQESIEGLVTNYIEAEMGSKGAALRIAMNGVPSLIFLLFRKYFSLSDNQQTFWNWMALGGLLFIVLLIVSPSSTAVDRIALYWIPIQIFVLSRLPGVLGPRLGGEQIWTALIVLYCACGLLGWLLFAVNSYAWLPYRFYPLELLLG